MDISRNIFIKYPTLLIVLITILIVKSTSIRQDDSALLCTGKIFKNVTLTAYYPTYSDEEGNERIEDYEDAHGKQLRTLQDYIDNREDYVTVSMDKELGIPYGSSVCIPELNAHYRRYINLQVRDSSKVLKNRKYSRIEICVRSEVDSYDLSVNRAVTLYFVNV